MNSYLDFVENLYSPISVETFKEMMESLPEKDIDFDNIEFFEGWDDPQDIDRIVSDILDYLISEKWEGPYTENVNFANKTFSLEYVPTVKVLKEIKEYFPKWKITNEQTITDTIEASEEKRNTLIKRITEFLDDASIATLSKIETLL